MKLWNVGKFLTVDEMMICYKGTYCPARQYMPQKPQKWGLKVWYIDNSNLKYFLNFEVYFSNEHVVNEEVHVTQRGSYREARLVHNLVLRFLRAK